MFMSLDSERVNIIIRKIDYCQLCKPSTVRYVSVPFNLQMYFHRSECVYIEL